MYKMIIVDDEPLIRSGLKNLIEWEVYGIEIAAEAENGMDAYLLIKSVQPDIALIDITMPNMNGLELLELCSHLAHCPKFIILSGYNDFEYVRTAMRYGVVNYLLKPVDQEELTNTVMSTVRVLDDAAAHKLQFQEGIATLRNDTLMRILTNRIEKSELREKCRFLKLSFHCTNMRIGILKPLFTSNERPQEWTNFSIAELCQTICSAYCGLYTAMNTSDNLILIFKDFSNQLNEKDFSRLLQNCQETLSGRLNLHFVTALGEKCSALNELPASYATCLQITEHKEITQRILPKDTFLDLENDTPVSFDYSALAQSLEMRSLASLQKFLHSYFTESLYQDEKIGLEGIKYQLIEFIILAMEELKSSILPNADIYSQKKNAFQIVASARSLYELEEKLILFFEALMMQLKHNASQSCSPLVQSALDYVSNNYPDCNLSLKTLANELNVNAAYLGRQFSLETNEYFSDYLNRIRISKAIHLLKTTSWKTAAIASSVGFSNISYFFTIFKKITGGRPGDYRNN